MGHRVAQQPKLSVCLSALRSLETLVYIQVFLKNVIYPFPRICFSFNTLEQIKANITLLKYRGCKCERLKKKSRKVKFLKLQRKDKTAVVCGELEKLLSNSGPIIIYL